MSAKICQQRYVSKFVTEFNQVPFEDASVIPLSLSGQEYMISKNIKMIRDAKASSCLAF